MTTIVRTPAEWPRILLARAGAPTEPGELPDGAFDALRRVVRDVGATGAIATIAASGLRGRGGAGFPTGEKWRTAAGTEADRRFVVANAYGADPASRTDLTLLELDPYAVIEGLAIAAFAIGAREAIVAVRADATGAVRAVEGAVAAATAAGYLGDNVLGSGRDIEMTVRPVQGAWMLGEETVLLKALEGRRGQPEQRPPYPAVRGLLGRPTVVQNVQTLAAVPWIILHGPEAFASIGAPASPGTILVSLRGPAGDGLAEVPLGTRLIDIVALGGDLPKARTLKAVLVGGPSGGLLPPAVLDTPYEFAALRSIGAHVGSGSVVTADDRACVVDLARLLTRFCADEACGKSIPCRIGTRRLFEIGDRFASGTAQPTDAVLLEDLSADIVGSALCDHERLTTLPLTTGMRYFRSEVDAHILRGVCPAGVCRPIAAPPAGVH